MILRRGEAPRVFSRYSLGAAQGPIKWHPVQAPRHQKISYVGIIDSRAITTSKPNEFGNTGQNWDREGWLVKVNWQPLKNPFQPKEVFDQNISGKFQGIGARLFKRNQQVEISEVIIGGPVWRDNLLNVGDIIIAVAQSKQEEPQEQHYNPSHDHAAGGR